jgi:hypothetical protein
MRYWKKLSPLRYIELAIFLVPLIWVKRHGGRPLLPAQGPATPEEESLGLQAGDTVLAPKLMTKWGDLAVDASKIHQNIKPSLILAVIHAGSRGSVHTVSPLGEEGLMQLTPGDQQNFGVSDPFDPWDNIEGGTHMLSFLSNRYHGNIFDTLVAYDLGIEKNDKAQRNGNHIPKKIREYANRVLALSALYRKLGG